MADRGRPGSLGRHGVGRQEQVVASSAGTAIALVDPWVLAVGTVAASGVTAGQCTGDRYAGGVSGPLDDGVTDPSAPRAAARRHLRRVVGVVVLALVAVFAAVAVKRNWDAVRADLGLLSPLDYVAASGAAVGGLLLLWATWSVVLGGLGTTIPRHDSMTIYFAAQLGKYVPGSVWPAIIQARLGRRNGASASSMVISYALWMGVLCAVGAITSVLVLTNGDIEVAWWVIAGCVLAALVALPVFLHDRGLPQLITWAMRRSGRSTETIRLPAAAGREATVLSAATWLVFGLHAWFLARPLGAGLAELPLVIGAFALAFVAGIVAVPLPAGAGLRETILVLTLGAAIGRSGAITVALLSRLIMILMEVLLASLTGVPGALRWAREDRAVLDPDAAPPAT